MIYMCPAHANIVFWVHRKILPPLSFCKSARKLSECSPPSSQKLFYVNSNRGGGGGGQLNDPEITLFIKMFLADSKCLMSNSHSWWVCVRIRALLLYATHRNWRGCKKTRRGGWPPRGGFESRVSRRIPCISLPAAF